MKSPFLSNNPRIDGEVILARLRVEMARSVNPSEPEQIVPNPPILMSHTDPPGMGLRVVPRMLVKALRWAKSLIFLQRTRFKLHQLELAHHHLHTQFEARQNAELPALQAVHDALRQEIAGLKRKQEFMAMEIALQQSRLSGLLAQSPRTVAPTDAVPPPAMVSDALDALYLSFEEEFRGRRDEIKERMRPHLDTFKNADAGLAGRPILDLGCGRGEWLEVLRENGLTARGIDLNTCNIELCRGLGLDVERIDALAALRDCPDGSLGGVSAFHLVEHLPFETMVALIDEALRALAEGGILLLETPNPESLMVSGRNFFFDPTHKHPIPSQVLSFVVERRGFTGVEVVRMHPYPREYLLDATQGQAESLLNELLFGPQDYAAIGRKP